MRIDFQFDNAAFHFRFLPFTIPYPVPFRLLGDETKVGQLCVLLVMMSGLAPQLPVAWFHNWPQDWMHKASVCHD